MSVSTVSKALNNNPSISKLTKDRVQKLATEWNYVRNETARHFKENKSFTIGIIIPDLLDQFYVLAINGVEKIANLHNYNVLVSQTYENKEKEKQIVENMIRNRVDGIIIAISKNTTEIDTFKRLTNSGIHVVFLSRFFSDPTFNYISTDNIDGALKAMQLLFERGHKRIAHLMGPSVLRTSHQRLEGYKKALETKGMSFDPALVEEVDFTEDATVAAVNKLMQLKNPPTAFFTFKNYVSLDVIRCLKRSYSAIADKIDVVGFGNLPLIQFLDQKPVASVDENSYTMGMKAAQLIFKNIQLTDKKESTQAQFIQVPCTLVIHNNSTA